MISDLWSNDPDIQKRYNEIVAQTRRLQAELGITPMTLEQRAEDYRRRQQEELARQEELKKLEEIIGKKRLPPKWKL